VQKLLAFLKSSNTPGTSWAVRKFTTARGWAISSTRRTIPIIAGTKAIQALSRADGRWYFLPVVELPAISTPGEDGYIVAECPRRPDFFGFPSYLVAMMEVR
jgi:hypothetical protein